MESKQEEKGGLFVLDSLSPEEFNDVVEFFRLLHKIKMENQKDAQGD